MSCRTSLIALALVSTVGTSAQLTLLDPSFGNGGVVLLSLSSFGGDLGEDIVALPDGRILVTGMRAGSPGSMALLRLMPGGALDPSFGIGGVAVANFGGNSEGHALAVQNDGAIVVGGHAEYPGVFDDLAFARFTPQGQLDPTFSGDGRRVFSGPGANDGIRTLSIAPDGRIFGSGKFEGEQPDMVAVVLTTEGEPDPSFATGGIFATTDHTGELAETHLLRADGRLVLCGAIRLIYPDADMAMLQLDAAGVPDPSFGVAGLFRPEEASTVSVVTSAFELNDGRILIAGRRFQPGIGAQEVFIGRITADGAWDPTYGIGGRSFLDVGIGNTASLRDMVLLADGKVLVAVNVLNGTESSVLVMRALPDGGLDGTFGANGRVEMPCPGDGCSASALALDAENRVLMVGNYNTVSGTHIMLMRWTQEASGVGVSENVERGIRAYPIPSSGELRLDCPSTMDSPSSAELVDASGRITHAFGQVELAAGRLMIPDRVADGIYALRIRSSHTVAGITVVVRR